MKKINALTVALVILFAGSALAVDSTKSAVIDINRASAEELAQLPYVGEKRAALIVARRQQKPFTSVDELIEIKGIGDKTLEKIRPHVIASPVSVVKNP